MKKHVFVLLLALLFLTGCGAQPDPHPAWPAAWVRVGDHLACETPAGFRLEEANDVLSLGGIFYTSWVSGPGRTITNADGDEAQIYDATLYLALLESPTQEEAAESVTEWLGLAEELFTTGESRTETAAGQVFQLVPILGTAETNPYDRGCAAFMHRGKYALSVELLCGEGYAGEPEAILLDFLNTIHYAEEG